MLLFLHHPEQTRFGARGERISFASIMRRKTVLNILVVAGLIVVGVTAWAYGPNLWTNWWVFVRSAGFSILFGWVWSGQLRALAAAGVSRGKWAAWVVVVVVFPLLLVLAIELFVFDRLLHASQRELAMLFLSILRAFVPLLAAIFAGLAVGMRIDASIPASRVFKIRKREPG